MTSSNTFGKIRARVRDAATGKIVSETKFIHNLVFDSGLNVLASGIGFANFFTYCLCGSSNLPTAIASGAITFTQIGTVITASGGFFAPGMTGALLKYGLAGSSGAEVYLTYDDATHATASIATPAANLPGTVYMVQQTGLQAPEYITNVYDTTAGNNTAVFGDSTATLQRVFKFATQLAAYSVNEIGYSNTGDGTLCNGRVVLPVTVTIQPTQFLEVTAILTYTVSPAAPTVVGTVGAGSFNTAGTVMNQCWNCSTVLPNGQSDALNGASLNFCDGGNNYSYLYGFLQTGTPPALNAAIALTPPPAIIPDITFISIETPVVISHAGQPVGVGTAVMPFSLVTDGQVITYLSFGRNDNTPHFQLNLSTPQTLPTGTFAGSLTFQFTFSRQLSN